ncbi:hypothetical protein K9M74_00935 [Candidatus Woesearchaeota archaeon]|nr:hypothetical protein [Candidatus Woesearchaeota archaeon]
MNEIKKQINNLVKEEVLSIKLFHKGYASIIYKVKTNKNNLLAKKFIQRKNITYQKRWSLSTAMLNEINVIEKLREANQSTIITPQITIIDRHNNIFIQKFIPSKEFYRSIVLSRITKLPVEKEIYRLGSLISRLHKQNYNNKNKTTILHADLSSHNIRFSHNKIFLFDPQGFKGDPYEDISKMIINFHLINPIIKLFISNKIMEQCKRAFIKGYEKENNQKIDEKKLILEMRKILIHERKLKENKLINRIKQQIMNYQNKLLVNKMENGKL